MPVRFFASAVARAGARFVTPASGHGSALRVAVRYVEKRGHRVAPLRCIATRATGEREESMVLMPAHAEHRPTSYQMAAGRGASSSEAYHCMVDSTSEMASPSARRTILGPYTATMPRTAWRLGLPPRKPLPPLHAPVVQRLSVATSRSPPLALQTLSAPDLLRVKGFPSPDLIAPSSRLQSADPAAEAHLSRRLRGDTHGRIVATGRERVRMQQRAKAQAAYSQWQVMRGEQMLHAERVAPREHQALTKEQRAALAFVFSNSAHVNDTADGLDRVDLRELRVVLRTLGCDKEEEEEIAYEADAHGGGGFAAVVDGEARLSANEFIAVFENGPKPPLMQERLTSIGKVIRGLTMEEEEAGFDQMFSLNASLPGSEARLAQRAKLREAVDESAREAFPYAVVADAERIHELVGKYEPVKPYTRALHARAVPLLAPRGRASRARCAADYHLTVCMPVVFLCAPSLSVLATHQKSAIAKETERIEGAKIKAQLKKEREKERRRLVALEAVRAGTPQVRKSGTPNSMARSATSVAAFAKLARKRV